MTEFAGTILDSEKYFCTKDYQGTIDLIMEKDGEKWILDWKNFALAKHKFGLVGEYKKPYSKLKKAGLQLSMYAHSQKATRIGIVELTKTGYYFYELPLVSKETIKVLLKEFKFNYIDQL